MFSFDISQNRKQGEKMVTFFSHVCLWLPILAFDSLNHVEFIWTQGEILNQLPRDRCFLN